jgi:hypothetical protein
MAAFAPERRVTFAAQVVASGQSVGKPRHVDLCHPCCILSISYPTAASRVCEVVGYASLRKNVRLSWEVNGLIMLFISLDVQNMRESSVVG